MRDFSRYQVKYRRRRQGKTDYRARLRLTTQDKNKYNTPKYRFVVRFTNKDVVCQVVYATMAGDRIVASAYSHELPRYGLSVGLTNYSAAYATGLLLARRVLQKLGLDKHYAGNTEDAGEDYTILKKYIFGGHVGEYMEEMQEEDPEKYQAHFAAYLKAGVEPEELEDLYTKVHENIRADPSIKAVEKKKPAEKKQWKATKLSYEQRKANLKSKLAELAADE
eukprot:scaffold12.g8191.t1